MQPFADPTAQKRNLSLAIEIAAHFLRNERHYLVDVLGKPLKKSLFTVFFMGDLVDVLGNRLSVQLVIS